MPNGSTVHTSDGAATAPRGFDRARSIAFFPIKDLHLPHNYREYFQSRELARRGWRVMWLRPHTGRNDGVPVEWPVLPFRDLDLRGRTYYLPVHLALKLRHAGVRWLWLSGWTVRSPKELDWLTAILCAFGIRVIYDPVDPICEFVAAQRGQPRPSPDCLSLMKRVYGRCDIVLAVTPELRNLLVAHGAPADRVVVARWANDRHAFDPARTQRALRRQLGLGPETFLVGWLGSMEYFKGLREIVQPLIESVAEAAPDVHFVIAGRGSLKPELEAWVRERGSLPVHFLPPVPYADAPDFTASLDAYIVPTNPSSGYARAICPVKCFDALAMGTPLVTTRTPATAFLEEVPSVSLAEFDVASFRDALLALRGRHGRAERVRVAEYSHQRTSAEIADVLEELAR